MVKYRVDIWGIRIKQIKISRETECFVYDANGNREMRVTSTHCYFDTWDEAKDNLVNREAANVKRCKKAYLAAEESLNKVRHIVKPRSAGGVG